MLSQSAAAQLSGRLTDEQHRAVEAATVVLLTADSTYAATTLSDSTGMFRFNQRPEGYRLLISHLLYLPRQVEGTGADVGTILLTPQTYALKEITVKGERPLVKAEGGKLTYDIPQLTRNRLVSNAYECIAKLPGVIEQDGTLLLGGAGQLTILLNGKPSTLSAGQLTALLKSMPASRVEKAEVMYTTPPQYHVRGASVNLVLKNYKPGDNEGWQGEVNGTYTYKYDHNASGRFTLTRLAPKMDIDLMYSAGRVQTQSKLTLEALHALNGQRYPVQQYTLNGTEQSRHHTRAGMHYKFTPQEKLDITYTGEYTPDSHPYSQTTGNVSEGFTRNSGNTYLHNISLAFLGRKGQKVGADYTHYKLATSQYLTDSDSKGNSTAFTTDSRQRIDQYKLYADHAQNLPKGWNLNYGASAAYTANRNTQAYDLPSMASQRVDSEIHEQTYNAYTGINKRFSSRLSATASATVEYYTLEGYHKWAVYPTLQVNYQASPTHILQGSFSTTKTYPPYWTLSGSTSYLNSYSEIEGNPLLRPYTTYAASFVYVLRQKYIFNLAYKHQPDYFQQAIYLRTDRLNAVYNTQNRDYNNRLSLTAVIPFKTTRWWSCRLTAVGMRQHDKASHYYDAPFDHSQWSGIGIWNNTFTLPRQPRLQAEFNLFGQSKAIQGNYEILPIWKADASLRYTFAKGKGELQLAGTDLFNTLNPRTRIRDGVQHLDMNLHNHNRSIQVSLTYRFGGYKQKKADEIDTSRFGQ